ncbi:lung adenoma susceptibility protein 2 [Embiotoca jacksoni]|uniref:lung adenoma susceptibility protein 2 n=1 Tax=Embiotoca jacksoni TaxID=100190 RepID=UPI003703FA7B
MESSGSDGTFRSPDSTVTSLLSSSGHLRSSLHPPEINTTFRYRDKDFDSASAALDAYIADFERSRQISGSSTGRLVLPHSRIGPTVGTLRNKDVLRERLTDRELDFLNLPVSSLHPHRNHDRLSMTTDELLSVPYDGSMPVTHTTAFLQGLLSRSGASGSGPSSSRPAHRAGAGLRSSSAPQHHHHHPPPLRTPRTSRRRPGVATFQPGADGGFKSAHRAARSDWAEPSSSLHLPRWLTSNKADMDWSSISSVPDLMYPAWIQHCDLSDPPTLTELWDNNGVRPPGAPSWVAELEKDDEPDHTPAPVDSQQTLRDLRLQFAEQISVLAERKGSDIRTTLFTDHRIESLIQKADQVLNSLSLSSGAAESPTESMSPVNTEELLHHSPFNLDSAAGGVTEALTDRGAKACDGTSSWKQPGPVEALKQMLFRLQAVEAELQRHQQEPAAPAVTAGLQTSVKQWSDGEAELQGVPGRPSLQRALHHLNCLKLLVDEPGKKRREEEEEKDEDEGRYSSSSADGPIGSQ